MNATADKKTMLAKLADGVEGTTTFTSRQDSSYRFRLDAKQAKLRFWLEDRKTKQQWQTTELEMKDFVPKDCVIPYTTFDDYAVCFLNCLWTSLPSDDFERELVPSEAKRDLWELRLTLKLRTFVSTWTPIYRFLSEPVPLERVDLLAAKVRDQEEVIERLANELEAVRGGSPPYLRATTTANAGNNRALVWVRDDTVAGDNNVIQVQADGTIQIQATGIFMVNIYVQNNSTTNSTTFQLVLNGVVIVSCVDICSSGHFHTSTVSYALMAKPNDRISVVYTANGYAYPNSSIIIYQLR